MPPSRKQAFLLSVCVVSVASCNVALTPTPEAPADAGLAQAVDRTEDRRAEAVAEQLELGGALEGDEALRVAEAIVSEARARDFDPSLVLAVIEVESRFDAFAVSSAGAMGLMQIRPQTGAALAARLEMDWQGPRTLFDPVANVVLGVAYLEVLRERFGDLETVLAAYNRGPTAIGRRVRHGAPVPAAYARRVLAAWAVHAEPDTRSS